jgi:uncharacterized protein YggE
MVNMFRLSSVFFFFSFCLPVFATQVNTITVSGSSTIEVVPDRFELKFSLIERGKNTAKLKLRIDEQTRQILRQFELLNIAKEHLETSRIYLRPIFQNESSYISNIELQGQKLPSGQRSRVDISKNPSKSNTEQTFTLMELQRQVTVTFDDFSQYEQMISGLLEVGIKRISQLNYFVKDSEIYYQKALTQAIKQAKSKAQVIAKSAGINLGKIINLDERSYGAPLRAVRATALADDSAPISLLGKTEVSAQVSVKFKID